ncbi:MAG: DUF721 domain-containing protein [Mycobacteriales bacterium]|nr:DUF721 domain-containing protein [Frankia sp.]
MSEDEPKRPTTEERLAAAEKRAAIRRTRGRGKTGADPVPFAVAVQRLFATRGWQTEVRVAGLLARWPELVGEDIAGHCEPERLVDGELTLVAESTAWATQLRLLARPLVERINAGLGGSVVRRVNVHGPSSGPRPGAGGWRVRGGRGPRDTYG